MNFWLVMWIIPWHIMVKMVNIHIYIYDYIWLIWLWRWISFFPLSLHMGCCRWLFKKPLVSLHLLLRPAISFRVTHWEGAELGGWWWASATLDFCGWGGGWGGGISVPVWIRAWVYIYLYMKTMIKSPHGILGGWTTQKILVWLTFLPKKKRILDTNENTGSICLTGKNFGNASNNCDLWKPPWKRISFRLRWPSSALYRLRQMIRSL